MEENPSRKPFRKTAQPQLLSQLSVRSPTKTKRTMNLFVFVFEGKGKPLASLLKLHEHSTVLTLTVLPRDDREGAVTHGESPTKSFQKGKLGRGTSPAELPDRQLWGTGEVSVSSSSREEKASPLKAQPSAAKGIAFSRDWRECLRGYSSLTDCSDSRIC